MSERVDSVIIHLDFAMLYGRASKGEKDMIFRRLLLGTLTLLGFASLAGAFLLWAMPLTVTYAQADEKVFVGSDECSDCHRGVTRPHADSAHGLALSADSERILGDFSQGEDLRTVTFPNEDSPRAFSADDIAYSIGTGRYSQAYVFDAGEDTYYVFPAQWNVVSQTWESLNLGETWASPAYNFVETCAECHTTGLDKERGRWREAGVQCETCHGAGSLHVDLLDEYRRPDEDEWDEILSAIDSGMSAQTCTTCHSRGTSPESAVGDWHPTGHAAQANMQGDEWALGGHINALSSLQEVEDAPETCLACHSQDASYRQRLIALVDDGDREGNMPEALTLSTAQEGVTCQTCHNPHSEDGHAFNLRQAAPEQCASCHSNNAFSQEHEGIHHPTQEMYEGVALIEGIPAVVGAHYTASERVECVTCHMPRVPLAEGAGLTRASHTFQPVMPAEGLPATLTDTCSACHSELASPAALADLISDIQGDTRARLDEARALVSAETPAWVTQALDFVEGDGSLGVHNYAYADALLDAVDVALGIRR